MKNKILLFLVFSFLWINQLSAQTGVYTVNTTNSVTTSGVVPSGSSATYLQTFGTAKQLTGGTNATLTLSGYEGKKITQIILEMRSNASSGNGNLDMAAGTGTYPSGYSTIYSISTNQFSNTAWNGAWSSSYVDVIKTLGTPYTVNTNEKIVIRINATANSLYIQSFSIVYESGSYWDASAGAGNGVGGSSSWISQSQAQFSTTATGSATLSAVATTGSVIYGGTAGTVTLGFSPTAANHAFETTNYSLSTSGTATRTLSGTINLNSHTVNLSPIATAGLTLPGIISGTGNLNQNGAGTTVLSGANTYTGTTSITSGVLSISANSNLGNISASVTLNGGNLTTTNTFSTARNVSLTANSTINVATGILTKNGGTLTGSGSLTKSGTGVLILPTSNTYTGKTIISQGFINATGESAFGASPAGFVADQITLNGGGIQASTGNINFSSNRGITLDVAGGVFETAASRTITLTNIVSGTGNLTKTGAGTVILSGVHTYSGQTVISAGMLQIGLGGSLPDASVVQLNGGTLSTGATTGFSETAGILNVNANSTIALGTGNHVLNFANSSGTTWNGATLTITGWVGSEGTSGIGGKIFIGNDASGLTVTQLAKITFQGFFYGTTILPTGEIVPAANSAPYFEIENLSGTAFGAVCVNATASTDATFDLYAYNLSGDVTIGPLTGFTFSTDGVTFANTLTITPIDGDFVETIRIRFSPANPGSFNGNVTISGGGVTPSPTIAVTATGVINSTPTLSIAITTGTNPECSGDTVTFTATPSSLGGGSAIYQWKLNGSNVGTNIPTYTNSTLLNSDTVSCELTVSGGACMVTTTATSNTITMTVHPVPAITASRPLSGGPVGTLVTITGTGFTAGSTVRFGNTAATDFTIISPTEIQAVVPNGAIGTTLEVRTALSCPATSAFTIINQVATGCN